METIAISKFKATCLAVLERVSKTGRRVRVTRFGKPVADIVPPAAPPLRAGWMGSMRGTAQIAGDIIGPLIEAEEWEAMADEWPRKKRRP